MPKLENIELLHTGTRMVLGSVCYIDPRCVGLWKEVRKLTGITKGQWKRFQCGLKGTPKYRGGKTELRITESSIKKLKVMARYHDHPHFMTLLKMVDAQEDT